MYPFFKVRCPNSANSVIEALQDAVKTDFGTNDALPTLAFLVGQTA
jgi:hypothetical protein